MQNRATILKNSLANFYNHKLTKQPRNFIPIFQTMRNKSVSTQRLVQNVHGSFIYNNEKSEKDSINPLEEWVNTLWYIDT